jgi:hypothetical protein
VQSQERESSHVFCVRGIDVATYYEFANDSLNCSNSGVFFALHIIVNPYLVSYCQSLNVMLTDCFVTLHIVSHRGSASADRMVFDIHLPTHVMTVTTDFWEFVLTLDNVYFVQLYKYDNTHAF